MTLFPLLISSALALGKPTYEPVPPDLRPYVPVEWKLLGLARGDLNGDGLPDAALAV